MKDFEILEHTADFKLRVYGSTREALFEHALAGMFQAIKPIAQDCVYKQDRLVCDTLPIHRTIQLDSIDQEILLIDFLNEALYLSDSHNEAYLKCQVHTLTESSIKATIYGVAINGFDGGEIKAVTYHQIHIEKINAYYQADILFDV